MAIHYLPQHFVRFFGRLNPSQSFEQTAASQYATIKGLIEDRNGRAAVLSPECFLQGSYRQQTAIHAINDVDVVVLCRLWQPGDGGGSSFGRDEIFQIIASPLLNDGRYSQKVRYNTQSMCIKVELGIKVEILPVVHKAGNYDSAAEPFRLYRPERKQWEDGFARYHQQRLTLKNSAERTGGNFIPMIKVLKHLRTITGLDAISFHIECLLYAVPDQYFRGSPADYIPAVLNYIAAIPATTWYANGCRTPCGDRNIFATTEWPVRNWQLFHNALSVWGRASQSASQASDRGYAIQFWRIVLGEDYFPVEAV